jgi:hypothetical protein
VSYLIWSNQHAMWWRPNERGYTQYIEEAGRYSRADAERIVNDATLGGRLGHRRVNPMTEERYTAFDEYAVLAPEATP